jgi:hypothetical protein
MRSPSTRYTASVGNAGGARSFVRSAAVFPAFVSNFSSVVTPSALRMPFQIDVFEGLPICYSPVPVL